MKESHHTRFLLVLTAAVLAASPLAAQTASNSERERFTAFAVNTSNVGPPGAMQVDLEITRWTSDAERDRLMQVFKEKGPNALLEVLRDTRPVGFIRTPDSLAYDLHYARQMPGEDGGRQIILVTDRPISFWEARNQPRSIEYPFTLVELQMDGKGEGVGKLSIATRITLNGNVLTLENFANQPVMLTTVRKQR